MLAQRGKDISLAPVTYSNNQRKFALILNSNYSLGGHCVTVFNFPRCFVIPGVTSAPSCPVKLGADVSPVTLWTIGRHSDIKMERRCISVCLCKAVIPERYLG